MAGRNPRRSAGRLTGAAYTRANAGCGLSSCGPMCARCVSGTGFRSGQRGGRTRFSSRRWPRWRHGWLVTRHDLAREAMRDPITFTVDDARFSTARVVGPSMLSLDGEEHARHRAPFAAPFRPTPVRERFATLAEAEAQQLVDEIR